MSFINAKVVGIDIDPEAYHTVKEERCTPDYPMSPSSLKEFANCPSRYKEGFKSPDSKAKDYGSILDTLILTPNRFNDRYVVTPETYPANARSTAVKDGVCGVGDPLPWDGKASYCKDWVKTNGDGKEVVPVKTYNMASAAVLRLMTFEPQLDYPIRRFIASSDKQVLVVGQWKDDDTGLTIPVRCLMDFRPRLDTEYAKCLGDLKSTRSGAIMPFSRDVFKMKYHVQAAFDLDLYLAATNEDRNTWCLIVQESFDPFEPGKRMMSDMPQTPGNYIELGRATYRRLLKNYCVCLKTGKWPTYDDHDEAVQGWTPLQAEPWMEFEFTFGRKFELPEEEEAEAVEEQRDDINV